MLYIIGPITAAIIQLFAYGLSLVNMAMVVAFICMYIFTYLDINDEVERIHSSEMAGMKEEQQSMYRLVDQIAGAFVESLSGDYFNVMGLPVCRVSEILAEFGIGLFDKDPH